MIKHCPNACKLCELKTNLKLRCNRERMGVNPFPVFGPDDLEAMFLNLTAGAFHKYSPEVLHRDPYVVRFENFVTDEEIAALQRTTKGKYERSWDQGNSLP
jgi:hypothetical protein